MASGAWVNTNRDRLYIVGIEETSDSVSTMQDIATSLDWMETYRQQSPPTQATDLLFAPHERTEFGHLAPVVKDPIR